MLLILSSSLLFKAQKSPKSKETMAEDVAGRAEEQEGEVIGPEEQREDEDQQEDEEQKEHEGEEHQEDGEQKEDEELEGNGSGRNSDDEETTQLGRHEEDDGQMRKEREEERLQDGGDEGEQMKSVTVNEGSHMKYTYKRIQRSILSEAKLIRSIRCADMSYS